MANVQPDRNDPNQNTAGTDETTARDKSAEFTHLAGEAADDVSSTVRDTASNATNSLSAAIKRRPMTSIAIAAGFGIGLALILSGTRRGQRPGSYTDYGQRVTGVTGADLREISHTVQDAVKHATSGDGLSSVSHNLVEALNNSGARDALADAVAQALAWWERLKR